MTGWVWPIIIIAGGIFLIKMLYVAATAWSIRATQGAIYVSTARQRIKAVLDAIVMDPGQRFVDLGCGDGRVLLAVKARFPGVDAVGYELNPMAYIRARISCAGRGIRVFRKNFWHASVSEADVIFCYLFPDVLSRLGEKLRSEAKAGAVVVSCNFPLPGFAPDKVLRPNGTLHGDPVFIYRMR